MKEKKWYALFELGILFKGVTGLLEIISGFLIFFTAKTTIVRIFITLTADELVEDPHDRIVSFFSNSLNYLTTQTQDFAALYILLHGVINIGLAISLYRKKPWAYTAALCALVLFIAYQLYRYTFSHALGLLLITLLDMIFVGVIWHERQRHVHVAEKQIQK